MLNEPTKEQAGIFQSLMRRALYIVEQPEYNRAKTLMEQKLKRKPMHKEVMREAKGIIPSRGILRANIEAILKYIYHKDIETELKLSMRDDTDTSPLPKRFLKSNRMVVRDVIRRQMIHVDKGCLSDPSDIAMIRIGSDGNRYTVRSTSTNERDNLDLCTKILTATHIRIHQAERLLYSHYEQSNNCKAIH